MSENFPKSWGLRFSTQKDVSYGTHISQKVDIHQQGTFVGEDDFIKRKMKFFEPSPTPCPTLIYFHGGGWLGLDKESRINLLIPYLERGWNVVNVEYRRGSGTAPQAMIDVHNVMNWLNNNFKNFNIDSENVVVSGDSAGGTLALLAGMFTTLPPTILPIGMFSTLPEDHPYYIKPTLKIKAIINWYGITDIKGVQENLSKTKAFGNFPINWLTGYNRHTLTENERIQMLKLSNAYSPIHYINKDTPPILTIQGREDTVNDCKFAEAFHKKLKETVKEGTKEFLYIQEAEEGKSKGNHGGFSYEQYQESFKHIFDLLDELVQ